MKGHRSASRLESIDLLRALAIVLMTVVHFVENLAGSWGVDGGPFIGANRYWWMPTGAAAPLFTFLSGVSYRLWVDALRARGRDDRAISKMSVRRGLFLILLGFAFNVLIWMPEDVFNWDILTLIGTGLLVLDVARRMAPLVPLAACGILVAVAPVLRAVADYPGHWIGGYYDYEFSLSDVLIGYLVTGYFPVFPWLAFPLAGFLAAPLVYRSDGPRPRLGAGAVGGLLLATTAALLLAPWVAVVPSASTAQPWTMFPPSTAYVLGTIGVTILAADVLHRSLDGRPDIRGPLVRVAGAMSRHSLTLYMLHHVAHVWPLWIAGFVTTGDPTGLWQVAMPVSTAIALAAGFLILAAWLIDRIDRAGLPTVESALRWLCEP